MSSHLPALISGCIQQLLVGAAFDNVQVEFVVQVIDTSISASSNGYGGCTITISDGEHFMDCYLSPQLLHLVRNAVLKKFALVRIGKVICYRVSDAVTLIVNELSVLSNNSDVINGPIPYSDVEKQSVVPSSLGSSVSDNVDAAATRTKFMVMQDNSAQVSPEDDTLGKKDEFIACENCNNEPCDWTEYGPSIICRINNEYAGKPHKQLRFLAYAAYTSAKHGYLGKRKREPIPHCVECGIRCNYPDDNNCYMGFREAPDM